MHGLKNGIIILIFYLVYTFWGTTKFASNEAVLANFINKTGKKDTISRRHAYIYALHM